MVARLAEHLDFLHRPRARIGSTPAGGYGEVILNTIAMTNDRASLALAIPPVPLAALLAADRGNGAAAGSVLLHRPPRGAGMGMPGLFVFLACMGALLLMWRRLHRNGPKL